MQSFVIYGNEHTFDNDDLKKWLVYMICSKCDSLLDKQSQRSLVFIGHATEMLNTTLPTMQPDSIL